MTPLTTTALYISGPMTGLPKFNFEAFNAAYLALCQRGYIVTNPAQMPPRPTYEDLMRNDFLAMASMNLIYERCGVALLPGWEGSNGSKRECDVARAYGWTVKPLDQWLNN